MYVARPLKKTRRIIPVIFHATMKKPSLNEMLQMVLHVKNTVDSNFANEFERMLNGSDFGSHEQYLRDMLARNPFDLGELFHYGMNELSKMEKKPDTALAAYFLALSSFEGIAKNLRDLALDTMLYCESDIDTPVPSRKEGILKRYEKMRPDLRKGRIG